MNLRTTLATVVTGCGLALASGAAMAVPCSGITTIGRGKLPGSCEQADKMWTIGANTLDDGVQVLFSRPDRGYSCHAAHRLRQLGPGGCLVDRLSISVTDPDFFIDAMFAGADNPGGGSSLTKDVTGDEAFNLSVMNGVEVRGRGGSVCRPPPSIQ